MNREMETKPANDAALFDMIHSLFGVGDFDDSEPWYKFRLREIAKLRAIRKAHGISVAEMATTAVYCKRHGEVIKQTWQLRGFIADAKREARRIAVPELSAEVSAALEQERALPGPDSATWIQRLLLTRGPFRRGVLDEWLNARKGTK